MTKFFNLHLFGEGGGDGGATASEGANGVTTAESGVATATPNAEEGVANPNEPTFEDLIGKNGRYKADYDAKVSEIVQSRLKSSKTEIESLNSTISKLQPALELLGMKYGIDASDLSKLDVEKLVQTITEDDSYYEEEAYEKGIPVETLKELKKAQRESEMAKRTIAEFEKRQRDQEALSHLIAQEQQLKQVYPNFDLRTEMENPTFGRMVASGASVRDAYEFAHRHELQPTAMSIVANTVQQKLVNSIASGSNRPVENGMSSVSTATTKIDPRNLTRDEMKSIRERVHRGEKITWN